MLHTLKILIKLGVVPQNFCQNHNPDQDQDQDFNLDFNTRTTLYT